MWNLNKIVPGVSTDRSLRGAFAISSSPCGLGAKLLGAALKKSDSRKGYGGYSGGCRSANYGYYYRSGLDEELRHEAGKQSSVGLWKEHMGRRFRFYFRIISTILFFLLWSQAAAQVGETGLALRPTGSASAAYYYAAKPGELTMFVNLWGSVERPGRYEVSSSTNLIQLISYAGGPAEGAKLNRVRIIRIMEDENGRFSKQKLTIDLENLENVEYEDLELFPGDTIVMANSSWPKIRDVIALTVGVATIGASIAVIYDILQR